jgi:anthranilate phosphoribosyltransferase
MNSVISWKEIFTELNNKNDLTSSAATWAIDQVMDGKATDSQIKDLLLGLKNKGESAGEITAFVNGMLRHSFKIEIDNNAVDTCGTGGDSFSTVNISTAAAIVVASCGIPVVKHGNRAASSKSGSADVLEALGISTSMNPDQVLQSFTECGITFCFAPTFHPAMRYVAAVRKELGVPTIFNILGPLANPAEPKAQVVGVANLKIAPLIAKSLADRNISAFVVRGLEGLDEISICGPTQIWQVKKGKVKEFIFNASDLGVNKVYIADLKGGDAQLNAKLIRDAFSQTASGPIYDAICVNAAASIVAYENVDQDFQISMQLALARAKGSISSGATLNTLNHWINFSQNLVVQ